jgi:hypothetical protein
MDWLIIHGWPRKLDEALCHWLQADLEGLNRGILEFREFQDELLATSVSYSNFPSIEIIPSDSILNDFSSKLVLQIESNLKGLAKTILINLFDLRRCSNFNIVELVLQNEIREVHVLLRDNLLCFEVVDTKPEELCSESTILVFSCLAED